MWFNQFFGRRNKEVRSQSSATPAKLGPRRLSSRQLQLEQLEDRRLLSITSGLAVGAVTLSSVDGITDTLTLDVDGGGFLRHSLSTLGDPAGYASDIDFVSGDGAVVSPILAANVTSISFTDTGGVDDVILAQDPGGATSSLSGLTSNPTLSITGVRSISDDGNIVIAGATTLSNVSAAHDITLDNATNNFASTVAVTSARDATLNDTNALTLAAVNVAGDLQLQAGGALTQTAALSAFGLELLGTGPITLTTPANNVATIAANSTGAVSYRDTDALAVGTVGGTAGITTGGNNLRLQTGGALTQTASISASGLELLGTGPITLTDPANSVATIAANTTGAVSYRDTDALVVGTVGGTAGITTGGNNLQLQTGGALTQTASISASGLELLGTGPVTLTDPANASTTIAANIGGALSYRDTNALVVGTVGGTSGITTGGNNVQLQTGAALTQTASISASGLELLGTGPVTLTDPTNAVTTIAANIGGALSYRDTNALIVGTVGGTSGINSGGNDVQLQTGAALTQTASISASGLELLGTGPVTLTDPTNAITTIAANIAGALNYRDTNALVVGTVGGTAGITTGGNNLQLQTGGALTQTASISASGLELLGTGPVTLTDPANAATTIAANIGGALSYRDTNALVVGTVGGTSGINSGGNDVQLQTGAALTQTASISASGLELLGTGPVTLTDPTNAVTTIAANIGGALRYRDTDGLVVGTVGGTAGINSGGNDVQLQTGAALTQTASIGASGLELLGTGPITLTDPTNAVTTIAANIAGALNYRDTNALVVGAVGGTVGVTTTNQNVTIRSGGMMTLAQLINAGSATATLTVGAGGLVDGNAGLNNISATNAALVSSGGIGSGNAIETAVSTLAASNTASGNIQIDNNVGGLLTIGTVGSVVGVTNTGGGVTITNVSPLTVADDVTASGTITLTATETAGPGDDLTVNGVDTATTGTVIILSNNGNVALNAGDNVVLTATIPATTRLSAPNGGITIDVDNANAGGNLDGTGSTVTLQDDTVLSSPNGTTITGGTDDDIFNVFPQLNSTVHVDGDAPTAATGDTLNVDLTGLTDAVIDLIPTTSGFVGLLNATPVGTVSWVNIETFDALGAAFDLRVRMDLSNNTTLNAPPFNLGPGVGLGDDGTADLITTAMVGTDLQVTVFDGISTSTLPIPLADIKSLEVVGSTDADTLFIPETVDGLPAFPGNFAAAPLSGGVSGSGHANSDFVAAGGTPTNVGIHFSGGAGVDAIDLSFTTDGVSVSYFADNDQPANSGNISVEGQYSLSFADVAPIDVLGAGAASTLLTVAAPATTVLDIADDANGAVITPPFGGLFGAPVAGDDVTAIQGNGGFETTRFANFGTVIVRGSVNADTITLHDIDAGGGTNPITNIILDGDDTTQSDASSDTLHVRTLPAGITAQLYGGAGADTFNLFDQATLGLANNTVDNIFGQVTISQAPPVLPPFLAFVEEGVVGDGDVLNIDDQGDITGPADNVWIGDDGIGVVSKITNITGFATTNSFINAGIDYGSGPVIVGPPSQHGQVETINIWTSNTLAEQVDVEQTRDGSVYNLYTLGGDDTVNIFSDSTTAAAPGIGNLNAIDGQVNVNTGAGTNDTLNVSDFGDANGDTYVFSFDTTTSGGATTAIEFADGTPDGAVTPDIRFNVTEDDALENFQIWGGTGNDVFTNEGASGGSRLQSNNPTTEFMLAAHNVNPTSNIFNGNGGDDTFTFEWASGFNLPATTLFEINGDLPQNTPATRDVVNLRANAASDGARNIGMTYQTAASGDVDVTGLHAAGGFVNVDTSEQVNYVGDGLNDDVVTVTGAAAGNNTLSVTPISATEANVFLAGTPLLTIPPDSPYANNPGVAAGAAGPDINLRGMRTQNDLTSTTSGLILQGVGNEDRLVVNAPTESNNGTVLNTAATSGFGGNAFGSSSTVRAVNQAFDNIDVTDSRVRIERFDNNNTSLGALIDVNIVTTSFDRALPTEAELTVNTGEENGIRTTGIADDVTVTLSTAFRFQINGGEPPLPAGPPLVGDRLNVAALPNGDINIHANDDPDGNTQVQPNIPNVSIFSQAGLLTSEPVVWHSIEIVNVRPDDATETVNIIGDDNGNNPGQQDEIIILGQDVDSTLSATGIAHPSDADGANEFSLLINGSNPIGVYNTSFLNITGQGGDDDITIDPYASDITGGWDIDVRVDGGDGTDDVFYGNIEREPLPISDDIQRGTIFVDATPDGSQAGVSEDVVLAPTTTAGEGQIRSTNAADGTDIVTIDFTTMEDVSFFFNDGTAGDTDSLTILGTGVADRITADFTNDGLIFDPTVGLVVASPNELIDVDADVDGDGIFESQLIQVHGMALAAVGANRSDPGRALCGQFRTG